MKKTIIIFLLTSTIAWGQQVNYNAIILPSSATNVDMAEKLVRLAWQNNPEVQKTFKDLEKSSLAEKYSKWNWLEAIRVTGNLNEFNIDKSNNELSTFYPRYNFSATFSLGTFFTSPIKTKIEKQNVEIGVQNINLLKLELRAEVLKRYQMYLSNKEFFEVRSQMEADSYSDFKLKEQSFARGETTLNDYTTSLDRYNLQKLSKIQAERDLQIALIELEQMIGVRLADVQ